MSYLNVRIGEEDEAHLARLRKLWGLSRSEATRKALEYAAVHIRKRKKSKMRILEESGFVGCYTDKNQKSVETRVKESLKKKYRTK